MAVFGEPAAMLMIRTAPTAACTGRFEREVLPEMSRVYRGALCLTGDPAQAEDLAVETFARAYRALPTRRPGLRLEAWLYRILVSAHRERRPAGQPALCGVIEDQSPVREMLRDLPENLRFAIHLADVDGFSYREIAEITGTTPVTAETRLRDARRLLRRRLSTGL
jgi:RNA polymerase sigma-70 factor, ECF subfamily